MKIEKCKEIRILCIVYFKDISQSFGFRFNRFWYKMKDLQIIHMSVPNDNLLHKLMPRIKSLTALSCVPGSKMYRHYRGNKISTFCWAEM